MAHVSAYVTGLCPIGGASGSMGTVRRRGISTRLMPAAAAAVLDL